MLILLFLPHCSQRLNILISTLRLEYVIWNIGNNQLAEHAYGRDQTLVERVWNVGLHFTRFLSLLRVSFLFVWLVYRRLKRRGTVVDVYSLLHGPLFETPLSGTLNGPGSAVSDGSCAKPSNASAVTNRPAPLPCSPPPASAEPTSSRGAWPIESAWNMTSSPTTSVSKIVTVSS